MASELVLDVERQYQGGVGLPIILTERIYVTTKQRKFLLNAIRTYRN